MSERKERALAILRKMLRDKEKELRVTRENIQDLEIRIEGSQVKEMAYFVAVRALTREITEWEKGE